MPEEHRFSMQMQQLPVFELEVADADATRAWRKRTIEAEVSLAGHLPLRIVLVGQGLQRIANLEQRIEAGIELEHAAMFLVGSRHPDVVRAYREGEITVEEGDGKYRAVVTLEYAHATGRWWTARRRVGTNQVSVGIFHGDWVEQEGEGLDGLGEVLREWVDTTRFELTESHQQLTPREDTPTLLVGTATLSAQPPPDPKIYAEIVGSMVDPQLAEECPKQLQIFAFRGLEVQQVIVEGPVTFPIEDLVRAIAAQRPTDAIALRHPGVAHLGNESFRSVVCAVECAGRRFDRIIAIKFGPNGKPVGMRVLEEDRGPVPPEGLWLGVPPKNAQVTFFLMGAPMPEAPEA